MERLLPAGTYFGNTAQNRTASGFSFSECAYAPAVHLPKHAHERSCFCFVLKGGYHENYGRRTRECTTGNLVFHPAGEVHSDQHHDTAVRLFCIDVDPARHQSLSTHGLVLDQPADFDSGPPTWLGGRLYREFQSQDAFSTLALEGLTLEIIAEASRHLSVSSHKTPPWLIQVEAFLRDSYTNHLRLDTIAAIVDVHPAHLVRVFRRYYGCTPADFVRRLRIEAACRRLSTSHDSLVSIALEAGFADQSHFSRIFRRLIGLTPAEYRREFPATK